MLGDSLVQPRGLEELRPWYPILQRSQRGPSTFALHWQDPVLSSHRPLFTVPSALQIQPGAKYVNTVYPQTFSVTSAVRNLVHRDVRRDFTYVCRHQGDPFDCGGWAGILEHTGHTLALWCGAYNFHTHLHSSVHWPRTPPSQTDSAVRGCYTHNLRTRQKGGIIYPDN